MIEKNTVISVPPVNSDISIKTVPYQMTSAYMPNMRH